jgi:hypothetical protein
MKLLSLIVISFLSFGQCEKFEIINATAKDWKADKPENGYGTVYELTIKTKVNSDILVFDKLWIGENFFQVQCYQKGKRVKNNTFGPDDEVTITVNHTTIPEKYQKFKEEKLHEDPPKSYDGEALLSYTLKGKRKYKTIKTFTKIKE